MTRLHRAAFAILLTIAVASIAGCGSDEPTPTPGPTLTPTQGPFVELHPAYAEPFVMSPPLDAAFIGPDGYQIRFRSVLADSRCPADAACLVPDIAILEFEILESATAIAATHQLFFDSGPSIETVGGYDIQVLALEPEPSELTSPSDYRATLLVTETASIVDAEVALTISAVSTSVGEPVEVTAQIEATNHTQYTLLIGSAVVSIVRDNGVPLRGSQTPVVEVLGASVSAGVVSWVITGTEPGTFRFTVAIVGEAEDGDGAAAFIQGSEAFTLTFD
jgi:hypothetical protein